MANSQKLLYTVTETASMLGVGKNTVYNLIHAGLLPAMKLGSLKIRKSTIDDFLDKYNGMNLDDLTDIKELSC